MAVTFHTVLPSASERYSGQLHTPPALCLQKWLSLPSGQEMGRQWCWNYPHSCTELNLSQPAYGWSITKQLNIHPYHYSNIISQATALKIQLQYQYSLAGHISSVPMMLDISTQINIRDSIKMITFIFKSKIVCYSIRNIKKD